MNAKLNPPMEHPTLDSQESKFRETLHALLKSKSPVKIHGWNRVKEEPLILDWIHVHRYSVEVFTILNCATLQPK